MAKFSQWIALAMVMAVVHAVPRRSVGSDPDTVLVQFKHVGPHRSPQNRQLDPENGDAKFGADAGPQLQEWNPAGDERNATTKDPQDLVDDELKNGSKLGGPTTPPCQFGSNGTCINHPEVKMSTSKREEPPMMQPIDLTNQNLMAQLGRNQPVIFLPTNQLAPDGTPHYIPVPMQAPGDQFEGPGMMTPNMMYSTGQQPMMMYPPMMPGMPPQAIQMVPMMSETADGMMTQMYPFMMPADYSVDPAVFAGGVIPEALQPGAVGNQLANVITEGEETPGSENGPVKPPPSEGPSDEPSPVPPLLPGEPGPPATTDVPDAVIPIATPTDMTMETTASPETTIMPFPPIIDMMMPVMMMPQMMTPMFEPIPPTLPNDTSWMMTSPRHMNHTALIEYLDKLHSHFKLSTRLETIGKSVQGRDIKSLVICGNLMECKKRPLLKPKFRFTGNIHGDEATGRGLTVWLAQFLLTNRDTNARVSRLLQTTEIHIVPSLNPDGFELAYGEYTSGIPGKDVSKGRRNANDRDINRDFPYIFNFSSPDDDGFWTGRQPETIAYMSQSIRELYVISGNIHTGDLIISIPLDAHRGDMKPTNYEARPPDYDLFLHIAKLYSYNHPDMHRDDHVCPHTLTSFPDGVVNGAAWYVVTGSAGDFVYKFANALELTMELSCQKFVDEESFRAEWDKNRDAMISLMEQSHLGVKGLVRHAGSLMPVPYAQVEIRNRRQLVYANTRGEYFRPLLDGHYEIRARDKLTTSPWIPFDVFNINGPTIVNIDFGDYSGGLLQKLGRHV